MSTAVSIRKKRRARDKNDEHRRETMSGMKDVVGRRARQKQPQDNSTSSVDKNSVKFACPFRKHDPAKYGLYESKTCALSHWSSVSRVKEHLYRCHRAPIYCRRCGDRFKALRDLNSHLIHGAGCPRPVRAVKLPEGITPAVEKALKSRKKSYPDQTKEDLWKDVYRILFPNEPVPNPYFEPVQEEPADPLGEYEEYSRQELPKLFRSILETHFATVQPGSKSWENDMVSAVEFCHERILADYRSKFPTDLTTTIAHISPKPASTTTAASTIAPAYAPTNSNALPCLPSADETMLVHSLSSFVNCTTDTDPTSHNGPWSVGPVPDLMSPSILNHNFDFTSDFGYGEEFESFT